MKFFFLKKKLLIGSLCVGLLAHSGCMKDDMRFDQPMRQLLVTATAYNSVPSQTMGNPFQAAWGDTLAPGMKAIAVSRDLIEMGLGHRTKVHIEGFRGEFLVLDKMAARWTNRIDIYMGMDVEAAKEWGVREVRIYWPALEDN